MRATTTMAEGATIALPATFRLVSMSTEFETIHIHRQRSLSLALPVSSPDPARSAAATARHASGLRIQSKNNLGLWHAKDVGVSHIALVTAGS